MVERQVAQIIRSTKQNISNYKKYYDAHENLQDDYKTSCLDNKQHQTKAWLHRKT